MKKILITGCAGFIGSHLVRHFINNGDQIIGIDNLSRKGSDINLKILQDNIAKNFTFCKEDIRNFKNLVNIFKDNGPFDLIIHQAAQVAVTISINNPREDFEINALGTLNMLEATRMHSPDSLFEFASTNKVYGKMSNLEVIERNNRYEYKDLISGIKEDCSLDFYSPYGCSKGSADQYVRDYNRIYGLRTVVLRQSCIYGTNQFGIEDQGWVAWFVIASILNKKISIYGDGKQGRDLLWVDDLVRVYASLYDNATKVAGKIFNIGGGVENIMSILELVSTLENSGVMKQKPSFLDWRLGDQKIFACDISNIFNEIGWKPTVCPKEGVAKLIDWATANKEIVKKVLV
jgi:CDP-paratose 2-epimerase